MTPGSVVFNERISEIVMRKEILNPTYKEENSRNHVVLFQPQIPKTQEILRELVQRPTLLFILLSLWASLLTIVK